MFHVITWVLLGSGLVGLIPAGFYVADLTETKVLSKQNYSLLSQTPPEKDNTPVSSFMGTRYNIGHFL